MISKFTKKELQEIRQNYTILRDKTLRVINDLSVLQGYCPDVADNKVISKVTINIKTDLISKAKMADELFFMDDDDIKAVDVHKTLPEVYGNLESAYWNAIDLINEIDPKIALNHYNAQDILSEMQLLEYRFEQINKSKGKFDEPDAVATSSQKLLKLKIEETQKMLDENQKFSEDWQTNMVVFVSNLSSYARNVGGEADVKNEYLFRAWQFANGNNFNGKGVLEYDKTIYNRDIDAHHF